LATRHAYLAGMNLFQRLFTRQPDPRQALLPAYQAIVARGRAPDWYLEGVPDTLDGRFEMIAAVLAHVLLRLEAEPDRALPSVQLTELFVDDMDSQLRLIGTGDLVVGKQVGKMMSALGGRLTVYRDAAGDAAALQAILLRNLWAGESDEGLATATSAASKAATRLAAFAAALRTLSADDIIGGKLPEVAGPVAPVEP
jgi:cytochrome b pre-mRNA-processing protein 3